MFSIHYMSSTFVSFCSEVEKLDLKVGSINLGQINFIMDLLRKNPSIKRVLETGFHTGLSAATFLDVREDIEVVSFDIFWFDYTRKAKLLLDKHYPFRNLLVAGNTAGSLQNYLKKTKDEPIDLVFVDGGHEWPVPYFDLQILLSSVKQDTIIIIDDYCEAHGTHGVIRAVNAIIELGLLKDVHIMQAEDRGMIVAKRSSTPFVPTVTQEELVQQLQDISSHYS